MKKLLISSGLLLFHITAVAQTFSESNSVPLQIDITAQNSIQLTWDNTIACSGYFLYRKAFGTSGWGGAIATINSTVSSYTDNTISTGQIYEYKIVRNAPSPGYGYTCGAIDSRINTDPGILIILIDDYFTSLNTEIELLINDLEADGWFVHRHFINRTQDVGSVKQLILNEYADAPTRVKSLFLLGHIPVPYSGNINPDGHTDHKGAWPADVFYGDTDGSWTDNSINNTAASDDRHHNIPGDLKYDQNTIIDAEIEVGRVDFYNLPAVSFTELELMTFYLNKLHQFKTTQYIPQNKAIVEDNFISMTEGFASSGLVSFSPIVGNSNVSNGDYLTNLLSEDFLFSFGTGPGTYSSAEGIISSNDFITNDLKSTFTVLFGSYFGDWDSQDNLLRTALTSGTVLASSWSGRPHIYYHSMGIGNRLGQCILTAQNNTTEYFATTTLSNKKSIHIAQMGDPSLRSHYVNSPQGFSAITDFDGSILLSWLPPNNSVDGYNLYRRKMDEETWTQANNSLITNTSYHDTDLTYGGDYEYLLRAVKKQSTGSGRYFNESLGVKHIVNSTVNLQLLSKENIYCYPNPFNNYLEVGNLSEDLQIQDICGREIYYLRQPRGQIKINTEKWPDGLYLVISGQSNYRILK